jgi:hypothetical protein
MNVREFVLDLGLTDGQSVRCACPVCHSSNDFSVSNIDGLILYRCYKLSCHTSSAIPISLSVAEIQERLRNRDVELSKKKASDLWVIPEYVIAPSQNNKALQTFIDRWDLHDVEILFDVKDKRAVFPIRSNNSLIDATGRSLDGGIPKWFRYTGNAPVYTSCRGKPNGTVVIVEDVISANTICSVCPNVTGMAILGTTLSSSHIEYIQDFVRIIVALDPDATHKTLKYKREIESWTDRHTIAMRLQDDIKYKTEADIQKLEGIL